MPFPGDGFIRIHYRFVPAAPQKSQAIVYHRRLCSFQRFNPSGYLLINSKYLCQNRYHLLIKENLSVDGFFVWL